VQSEEIAQVAVRKQTTQYTVSERDAILLDKAQIPRLHSHTQLTGDTDAP
jgi:hypothetical protein